ncbi:TPA: N-acetylmuramic acid 6-phosphate etherase [Candidatus Latescibacteria bacterium]|nr:N-acetylmuramic acid 6-phosphate etherase [Candidatus Latescibacterota bacterium]
MADSSSHWAGLLTEQRNPKSTNLDAMSTLDAVRLVNEEDRSVVEAVASQSASIAAAVDLAVDRMARGGRLFYVGAGTSGRLGVLDASECPPTFGTDPERVQGIIAGGPEALIRSQEGAEDNRDRGAEETRERQVGANDVVVGIAASGVTPYVHGALDAARSLGAGTIFFTCNPASTEQLKVDVAIATAVGPEVVTGSTRLKAGTATKLILNTISTLTMVKLGKVYENLMVDVQPMSAKLHDRARRILGALTELSEAEAATAIEAAGNDLKTAIVQTKRAVSVETARDLLKKHNGVVRSALEDQDLL